MSVISLDNQVYLNILIDNYDIPTSGQFLNEIQIIENIAQVVPTMSVQINDIDDIFSDKIALTDGNVFDLTIGMSESEVSGDDSNMNKVFRTFSYQGKRYQSGYRYAITGLYNIPKFTHNVASTHYEGTTCDVMRIIAKECGLDCEIDGVPTIDPTEDHQVWFNINETPMSFSRKLALHSYINNGLMLHCVTSDATLFYKNVIEVMSKEPTILFTTSNKNPAPTIFPVYEWEIASNAGLFNAWLNYGYNLTEPKLDEASAQHNTISLTSDSGNVVINKDVQELIEYTRKDYAPIDCGNTHGKYWLGYHTNLRRMALFSQRVLVLIPQVTNVNVLETVQFEVINSGSGKLTSHTGKYLVTAKKTIIRGTRYAEIFELLRPTYPIEGMAPLVGGN